MFSNTVLTAVLAAFVVTADAVVINKADNNTAPVAQTKAGLVRGGFCPKSTTKHFQGIPYAKPPVKELRFMALQDFDGKFPAEGLDATKVPPPCVQFPPEFFDVPSPEFSEDCLYLDVYAPASAKPGSNLPVKVWAYGGGNEGGALSMPLYDGCNSADDAVIVSFNYRLGPLGFMTLGDAGIEGNMAIKDYVKALEWVQANIASFGGDASQVLLFGQSAGGSDTFVVSTLPQAKSLMKSAAIQSGGSQDLVDRHAADTVGASFAETLGCSRSDLKCLQSKTPQQLMDAIPKTPALANNTVATSIYGVEIPGVADLASPILDGKFIKEQPLTAGSQVPVIVGSTGMDGSLLTLPYLFDFIDKGQLNEKNYTDFLSSFGPAADTVAKQYPLSLFNESGQIGITVATAITYITTMTAFQCPANKVLRAATNAGNAAYAYRWDLTPTCPWLFNGNAPFPTGDSRDIFGATHSAEIPYIFGNTDNMPYGVGNCSLSAAEKDVSKKVKAAWTAMAAHGSPVRKEQAWSKFNACDNNGLHVTKDNTLVVEKLDFDECAFWDEIIEQLGGVHVPRPGKGSCKGSPCKPKSKHN